MSHSISIRHRMRHLQDVSFHKADWLLDFLCYILDIFKNLLNIASPVAGLSRVSPATERSDSCHFSRIIYTFSHTVSSSQMFIFPRISAVPPKKQFISLTLRGGENLLSVVIIKYYLTTNL